MPNDKVGKKKWTVMVYLGADNNLSVDFLWDLKEMQEARERVGTNDIAVLAQYDPGQGIPTQRYVFDGKSTAGHLDNHKDGWLMLDQTRICDSQNEDIKRLLTAAIGKIKTEKDPHRIRLNSCLTRLNGMSNNNNPQNMNTGDPLTLLQFIFWGIAAYPAAHYMVVLAGHGSGADEDFLLKDNSSKDSLTLHELRDVFQLVHKRLVDTDHPAKLDILGMDSCLMSMAEVYCQLKDSVSYLVGAEGFEPTSGWPYQRILDSLTKLIKTSETKSDPEPDKFVETFAKNIVDDYVLYYFDYALAGLSVDLSACETENVEKLTDAIKELGKQLVKKLKARASRDKVLSARQKAQSYKFDQYVDLGHFCGLLKEEFQDLNGVFDKVREALKSIVKNSSYVGPDYQNSSGLSVYFPWNSVSEGYKQLAFPQEWHQFLEGFTEAIRAQLATSDEIRVDESKTRYAGRTLYSARTLYGGRSSGLGPGEPLYMAYSKAPSIVWKPAEKSQISHHVQALGELLAAKPTAHPGIPQPSVESLSQEDLTEYLGVEGKPKAKTVKSHVEGKPKAKTAKAQ